MSEWWRWLEASALASRVRDGVWLYPAVEALHIIGFSIVVGAAVIFDLRLLGFSPVLRVSDLARHVLPWARGSFFLVVVPTGALLFATQATTLATSRLFQLKLLLIAVAGLNTFLFHSGKSASRIAGAASLILWLAVIVCGRWLAYV
jgi:hypothetical protein